MSVILLIAYFAIPRYTEHEDAEGNKVRDKSVLYLVFLFYSLCVLIIDVKLIVTGHNDLFVEIKRSNSQENPFPQDYTTLTVMKLYLDQICLFMVLIKILVDDQ